jgi:phospholipid-translocating ATPase
MEDGIKLYQASSPDEIALVQLAESLKMMLIRRDQREIEIEPPAGKREVYDILACFPFSSDTKRMGIILRMKATNRIIFYLKGADTIMKNKVNYL